MFSFNFGKELAIRVLLIAVILFNTLASNPVLAHAEDDSTATNASQINEGKQDSRSIPNFPTFERPEPRVGECNDNTSLTESSNNQNYQPVMFIEKDASVDLLSASQPSRFSTVSAPSCPTGLNLFGYTASVSGWPWVGKHIHSDTFACFNVSSSTIYCNGHMSADVATGFNSGESYHDVYLTGIVGGTLLYFDSRATLCGSATGCVDPLSGSMSWNGYHANTEYGAYGGNFDSNNGVYHVRFTERMDGNESPLGIQDVFLDFELFISMGQDCLHQYPAVSEASHRSVCSTDGCLLQNSDGIVGQPINTRTGNYEYYAEDISIPTSAGNLGFIRDYVSSTVSSNTTLSPGWTHNHDTHLVFPTDPGGQPDTVLFKAHTANGYAFHINNSFDGFIIPEYTPEPGLNATLVKKQGTPITYTLKDSGQKIYTFDETGKLLTYADAEGHAWTYAYYTNGKLDRVTAEGGAYLDLDYDAQGRVALVKDRTNRSVSYTYNANGDLDTFIDVLGQTWTYEYNDPNLNHYLIRVAAPGNVTIER